LAEEHKEIQETYSMDFSHARQLIEDFISCRQAKSLDECIDLLANFTFKPRKLEEEESKEPSSVKPSVELLVDAQLNAKVQKVKSFHSLLRFVYHHYQADTLLNC